MRRTVVLIALLVSCMLGVYIWVTSRPPNLDNAPVAEAETPERKYAAGKLSSTAATIAASDSTDSDLLMLAANCYRRLGQFDEFVSVINTAQRLNIEPAKIKLATDLFDVQFGRFRESTNQKMQELQSRGVTVDDALSTVVLGALSRGDLAGAASLLDQLQVQQSNVRELGYLRAMLARSQARWKEAEALLLEAIASNEQHELTYLSLADFYLQPPNNNLVKCRMVLEQCRLRFPENANIPLLLARIHRELGDISAANAMLSVEEPSLAEAIERAQLALDAGKYEQAIEWLGKSQLSDTTEFVSMIDAAFQMNLQQPSNAADQLSQRAKWGATTLALGGRNKQAAVVFDFIYDRVARLRRLSDLRAKGSLLPQTQVRFDEMNALAAPAANPGHPTLSGVLPIEQTTLPPGDQLYIEHCSACHGSNGNGTGRAARHLFPAPRSFRDEPMRLVSTKNRLASDQDLAQTIRAGLGGASMPAFPQLSDEQIQQIIAVVRRFQVDGLRDQYKQERVNSAIENVALDDNEYDQQEVRQWVSRRSVPGETLLLPSFDGLGEGATASGEASFNRIGCNQCHVVSSEKADNLARHFDSLGRPIAVRDLINGRFRSGNSREEIYKRVVLGMPGTPHPAIGNVPEKEILDIVQYIHELSGKSHASAQSGNSRTTNDQRRRMSAL